MLRVVDSPRNPRALHPGAWWLWAGGLAVAASRTLNPILLVLIAAVAGFVVAARRTDAPWSRAYSLFMKIALVVVAVRVLLQAVLSTYSQGTHVLVVLPQIPLPDLVRGIKLGGVVTWEAFCEALYAGLQLGVMLLCLGAANALASPLRLLRALPGALYEAQVACVVALTFAPQLAADARRVRAARRLRGQRVRLHSVFATTMMPVIESALDRAVHLAAAMESRGFGRTRHLSRRARVTTTVVSIGGIVGLLGGIYGAVSSSIAGWLATASLVAGVALVMAALAMGRDRAIRSRYRPDPWALPEWLVAACGLAPAVGLALLAARGAGGLQPAGPLAVPALDAVAVAVILVGTLAAVAAPDPRVRLATSATRPVPAAEVAP